MASVSLCFVFPVFTDLPTGSGFPTRCMLEYQNRGQGWGPGRFLIHLARQRLSIQVCEYANAAVGVWPQARHSASRSVKGWVTQRGWQGTPGKRSAPTNATRWWIRHFTQGHPAPPGPSGEKLQVCFRQAPTPCQTDLARIPFSELHLL